MLLKVPIKQAGLLAREPRYNLRWSKFNAARASAEGPMIHWSMALGKVSRSRQEWSWSQISHPDWLTRLLKRSCRMPLWQVEADKNALAEVGDSRCQKLLSVTCNCAAFGS